MKKIIFITILIMVFLLPFYSCRKSENQSFTVKLYGQQIETVKPIIIDGKYFLSLQDISGALGFGIEEGKEDNNILFITDYNTLNIELNKNSEVFKAGLLSKNMSAMPIQKDDNLMLPLQFYEQAFDLKATVDSINNIIDLNMSNPYLIHSKIALQIFLPGNTAKAIDVRTGREYNLRRSLGGFDTLADVETLTQADTDVLKDTFGGDFIQLYRRPIIIVINDVYIAASIQAWPHSGCLKGTPYGEWSDNRSGGVTPGLNLNYIENNGMLGVVDVFFYNSHLPQGKNTCPMHQAAVLEAANNFDLEDYLTRA